MSTSVDDPNKPVTGYPAPGYPPAAQSSNNNNNNYHGYQAQNGYPASTAGTAYPYTAAPPPAAYMNQNPYPPPPQQRYYDPRQNSFLRRAIIAGITVFLIIGAITFIMWLVIRPHLPQIRVDSASMTNFNINGSQQLTADWDIVYAVRNPNKKMTIFYDRIESAVFYRDESLAPANLVPFAQGKRNETTIQGSYTIERNYLPEGIVNRLSRERSGGSMSFNVRMIAWVRFRSGAWRTRRHVMRIFCDSVRIGLSANSASKGSLIGRPECSVNL